MHEIELGGKARAPHRRAARRSVVIASAAVAVALVMTACSSSSKSSAGSATNTGAGNSPSSTASASGAANGTPLKVMLIDDVTAPTAFPNPQVAAAGKASVDYINANGGVAGHPIDLTVCDSQGDPNQASTCARNAVSDGVVAVVGSYSANADRITPILADAKIPYIPSEADDPTEFSSPISFPASSGLLSLPGEGVLAGQNCASSVTVLPDLPSDGVYESLINAGLKSAGKPAATVVKVPVVPGDYSAQVTQLINSKASCIITSLSVGEELTLFPALQSAGSKQRIVAFTGSFTADVVAKVPTFTEGALVIGFTPTYSSPKWDTYRAFVAKYSDPKKYDFSGSGGQLAWTAFLIFEQAAKTVLASNQQVTAATLLSTLNASTAVNTQGLIPTLDFTKPAPLKGYGRMFGRYVTFQTIKSGQYVSLDNNRFHDLTPALTIALGAA